MQKAGTASVAARSWQDRVKCHRGNRKGVTEWGVSILKLWEIIEVVQDVETQSKVMKSIVAHSVARYTVVLVQIGVEMEEIITAQDAVLVIT